MPSRRKFKTYCLNCNKELKLKHYKTCNGKYNQKFCSRKCMSQFWQGSKHPSFKNGNFIDSQGYKKILEVGKGKYIFEHRFVMERALGRKLRKNEYVHHKDGNKLNNNLSNLLLISDSRHTTLHLTGKPAPFNQRYKIVNELSKPIKLNEIISLLPEYRTYITMKCPICHNLSWRRKDYISIYCSPTCLGKSRIGKHRINKHFV